MLGTILGGVGLFLLGMSLLTDGLQAVAGDSLRRGLQRWTKSSLSAVITGAMATAVVQSSSATTLLCIGFVGAGLLSFTSALGVVFGANFGTTVTSWIVATVGLKLKISYVALPLVGVGALGKLFLRGRHRSWGSVVAGFGLIFVGIGLLQEGMQSISGWFDPARFAGTGLGTTLLLVGVGIVMTVVMQSSSAAVATTLAAVDTGAIGLGHAAALVIGQNVGTTVTAIIGSLGGSAPVKRTAAAHTVFNVGTGLAALVLLPVFWAFMGDRAAQADPAIALSIFHSAFNLLGLLIFVPLIPRLARWLERIIPEVGAALTRRLAMGRAGFPEALLEAARKTARDIAVALLERAQPLIDGSSTELDEASHELLETAIQRTREALQDVRTDPAVPHQYRGHVAVLHTLDHLSRLLEALTETARIARIARGGEPKAMAEVLAPGLSDLKLWLAGDEGPPPPMERLSRSVAERRRRARPELLEATARGELTGDEAEAQLEAMRWVDRVGYHSWRATHHLQQALDEGQLPPSPAPESEGRRGDESYTVRA